MVDIAQVSFPTFKVGVSSGITTALNILGASGSTRTIQVFSGDSVTSNLRWALSVDSTLESGSNAGSNLTLKAYSDTGSVLSTPISITRSSGAVVLGGTLTTVSSIQSQAGNLISGTTTTNNPAVTIQGAAASLRAVNISTGSTTRWRFGGGNTAETGSNAGTDFFINNYNDAGTLIGTPFGISRASGNISISNQLTVNQQINAPVFFGNAGTYTLSGSQVPTMNLNIGGAYSGSTTSYNFPFFQIGTVADSLVTTGVYTFYVVDRMTAGWDGSRVGICTLVAPSAATTLSDGSHGPIGGVFQAESAYNMGGVASGYGVSQFGMGNLFGSLSRVLAQSGSTYMRSAIGMEIDVDCYAGSNICSEVGLQIVHESVHATQGLIISSGFILADQVGASAAWLNGICIGSYSGQWSIDPNGYLFQTQFGNNYGIHPSNAAGGIDLLQTNFTGVGKVGGGFAFRSTGTQIDNSGGYQIGYGYISSSATGLNIDVTYQQLNGTPTVVAGGSGYTSGDLVSDAYGNLYTITAPSGAVTAVTVVKRGYTSAPPANPVSTTALTRAGSSIGSGLTLNLSWSAHTILALNPSGGNITLGSSSALANAATTGFVKIPFVAGTPTGNTGTGQPAVVYDTTANKIWVGINGTWKSVALT